MDGATNLVKSVMWGHSRSSSPGPTAADQRRWSAIHTSVLSNFLFGYHIGVMNGPIISVARELGFDGNPILEGLVVSIFIVGAFLGSISSGSLLDKLGFRRTFQIATIPLIVGGLLRYLVLVECILTVFSLADYHCLTRRVRVSAQAHTLDEILWGRFLVGLGIGVNTVLVPIYISEVAPTKYRGTLGGLCQIGTWRTMLYIASLPGFFIAFGMQFAVESPRWLSKDFVSSFFRGSIWCSRLDELNESRVVISNLWGESEVERAVEEFQSVIRNDGSDLNSEWSELLEEPNFRDVGITNGALASLVIGITNFAELSHNLSIVGTIAYIFSFAIGAGPVTGIIIPELSSNRARGKIMGFSLAVCNFSVGLFFLDLVQTFGVAPVYASFGAFSLVAAIFSKYFLVETKGRSLEEIEMALNPNFHGSDK
ncbi:putative plastidic glucose transporter 1, partial [Cucurbita argyrosperma subsp. argyrosperma]